MSKCSSYKKILKLLLSPMQYYVMNPQDLIIWLYQERCVYVKSYYELLLTHEREKRTNDDTLKKFNVLLTDMIARINKFEETTLRQAELIKKLTITHEKSKNSTEETSTD